MRRQDKRRPQKNSRDSRITDRQNQDFFEDAARDVAARQEHKFSRARRAALVWKRPPVTLTENHHKYSELLQKCIVIIALGAAGAGKTFGAVKRAVELLERGEIGRIVIARPAMETGENLGFMPGDIREKMDPYLQPLFDALDDLLDNNRAQAKNKREHYLKDGTIEIVPIAFMRGRTFDNAFVIIDEAQNCSYKVLRMILTRIGVNSTLVLAGDETQSDIENGQSALRSLAKLVGSDPAVGTITFTEKDVLRSEIAARMLAAIPEESAIEKGPNKHMSMAQAVQEMSEVITGFASNMHQAQTANNDKIDKLATAVAGLVATMQMSAQIQQVEQVQTLIEKAAAALTKPGTKKHKDGRAPNKGTRPKQNGKVLPFQAVSRHGR